MRFSIITCLFFLVLFIQPVAAEEAELELEMGLVKIMRAGKALVFNEKGSKIPLLLKDEIQTGANSKAQIRLPGNCLLYTSPSPRDLSTSRMPSSA